MPALLTPVRAVKCTYPTCPASFDTEKAMKKHKKNAEEHDYCRRCDKDFDSFEDYTRHKIYVPDLHGRACGACGEEFKSKSGLQRHFELSHKIKQEIECIGCREKFSMPALLTEHLEFDHCPIINNQQFIGHVIHKVLIGELLMGGKEHDRFRQKISHYNAGLDQEEEGGVSVENPMDDDNDEAPKVQFQALKPEVAPSQPHNPRSTPSRNESATTVPSITSGLDGMSLAGSDSDTIIGDEPTKAAQTSKTKPKVWGRGSAKKLFPQANPKPEPPKAVGDHTIEEQTTREYGINVMNTRFWDPLSPDWNPEPFFNVLIQKYYCPFPCEQSFQNTPELRDHILVSHRVNRAKCPYCLKYFDTITALMGHCQSRGSKCQVNKATDFNKFLDKLTGGFICVEEKPRPDYLADKAADIMDARTGELVRYEPPETPQAVTYLKYTAGIPVDWKEPIKVAAQIGGGGTSGTFIHKNHLSRW